MPHFDRGVYEPNDELRVFDGSEEDDDVEGSRLPLLIVLALLVLAMFAGVVWLAYTQGVARGRTETPVLTAQNGPSRIAPQNPGGAEEPYKGFKIYEQPAPPDDDVDTSTASAAPAATSAAPTPAPAKSEALPAPPVVAPKPVVVAAPPAPVAAKPEPAKLAAAAPKPVAVAVTPKPAPVKIAAAAPAPALAQTKPAPAAVKVTAATPPAITKTALPPASAPAGTATSAPRALVPAAKFVPAATPPAQAAPTATPSGNMVLQIGAYKSQAEADAAWKSYKAKHAALLAGANEDVQQADLGDKGTWYRLRLVGFPSKDVASAMCDRLKADGGACFLGK